jgi:hypothetical protein
MNKVKMFFIAAALVLTTAGVFAGRAKFANPSNLWAYNSSVGAFEISTGSFVSGALSTTPSGNQAQITSSSSGANYLLYQITGSPAVYTPVYTLSF